MRNDFNKVLRTKEGRGIWVVGPIIFFLKQVGNIEFGYEKSTACVAVSMLSRS